MIKDSFELSHPIQVDVINPNEITSLFDSISYDKVFYLYLYFVTKIKKKIDLQQWVSSRSHSLFRIRIRTRFCILKIASMINSF
jgi:hypothetical protein